MVPLKKRSGLSISSFILPSCATIKDAIKKIDEAGKEIAIICEGKELVGIVTDSDIRRGILKGIGLEDSAEKVINYNYTYAWFDEDRDSVYLRMSRDYIKQMPVINEDREIVDIYFLSDFGKIKTEITTPVLIMAGGLGTRLRPLTNRTPKPMLNVGGKPLLETIIQQIKQYGFQNILLSVNYEKEMIQNYFQDGTNFGVEIKYIEETERMGTAGAIRLAKKYLKEPFFVVNGDLLTKLNFKTFLDYHLNENVAMTIATTSHSVQVPYGVVEMNDHRVTEIKEKPLLDFFINAGIYSLNPDIVDLIPEGQFYDMNQLIARILSSGMSIASFPIHEYWMDIGQVADYQKANEEYKDKF